MDTFDDPRIRARARASKRRLTIWIILMVALIAVCGLTRSVLTGYSVLTTSAQPGETTTLELLNTVANFDVQVGERKVHVSGIGSMIESYGDVEIVCQQETITARPSIEEADYAFGLRLVNKCKQAVLVKVCWYEQAWLRFFLIPLFGC